MDLTQCQLKKFRMVKFRNMCSLGSFAIKDFREQSPGTWWYEITFLFIEITWGWMYIPNKK